MPALAWLKASYYAFQMPTGNFVKKTCKLTSMLTLERRVSIRAEFVGTIGTGATEIYDPKDFNIGTYILILAFRQHNSGKLAVSQSGWADTVTRTSC